MKNLKQLIKEEIKRILSEDMGDNNKNSMIRGMMNMLKDPEIRKASFEDLMNLNIAMQQLIHTKVYTALAFLYFLTISCLVFKYAKASLSPSLDFFSLYVSITF